MLLARVPFPEACRMHRTFRPGASKTLDAAPSPLSANSPRLCGVQLLSPSLKQNASAIKTGGERTVQPQVTAVTTPALLQLSSS